MISNEVIRTYNAVDNRVKDHASGLQMSWKEVVEKPNLEPMIEARARARARSESRDNVNSGRAR